MSTQPLNPRADADFDLYPYIPSDAAAYTFLVLFSIAGVTHLLMMPVLRSWFFVPLILGCAGEAAGYYGRAINHSNIRNGGAYLLQLMLILASAPLIAATVYMTLGRVISALDAREHAIMSPRWTTKIYVLIDIVSFCAQLAGSAMQSSGDPAGVAQGRTIVIAGLGVQLAALCFFMINAAVFHRRLNQKPTPTSTRTYVKWNQHLWTLYSVCTLIVVRSIFRLVEFIEGPEGHTYKTEAYLYVFDAALMLISVVAIAVVHPGMLLRSIRKAEIRQVSRERNGEFLLQKNVDK